MKRTLTVMSLAVALIVSGTANAEILIPPVPAERGTEAEYQRSLRSGGDAQKQMNRKRYKKMLFHAETAWATYKSPTFALLQGIAHARLKNPSEAVKWLLVARAMKPASAIVEAIDNEFAKVGPLIRMGMLTVKAPKGTTVKVDGTAITLPVVGISYGDHVITATREGYVPFKAALAISESALETVTLTLKKLPAVVTKNVEPPPAVVSPPAQADEPSIALPLGLIIGGVVVAGAGAGLHAWGMGADSDADDVNGSWDGLTYEESRAQFDDLRAQGETGAFAAYGLYALGGGLILAGAIVWALQDTTDNEGSADVVLTPALQRGGLTAVLSGSF